jgi:hypothetical protein
LKTPRKKMSANPPASILHNKKYNMRSPIFASILLPLPSHAQDNAEGLVQKSETQFLPECKPHAQKLLTQFLWHLPTHHPEIENFTRVSYDRLLSLKMLKDDFSKFEKDGRENKPALNERFGAMAGVARWIVLQNSKLCGSWQVCVARHCAKPPPR